MGRARGLLGQEEQHLRQGSWWGDTGVPWVAPPTPVLRRAAGGQRSQLVSPLPFPSSWFFPFTLITGKPCFASFARIIWSQVPDFNREGDGTPLQYSCLENPMDGGAWWAAVHGVAKSWTQLSDFIFTFCFHAWRRIWQPTPVLLPGESQGWGSLVGCRLWGPQSWTRLKQLSSSRTFRVIRTKKCLLTISQTITNFKY